MTPTQNQATPATSKTSSNPMTFASFENAWAFPTASPTGTGSTLRTGSSGSTARSRRSTWTRKTGEQCDQIGRFFVTNFSTKLDQIFGDFWSYFEKGHILCKNCCGYFLGNFEGKFGYFLFQHMVALLMSHHISGPGQGDQPDYDGKKNHSNQSKML